MMSLDAGTIARFWIKVKVGKPDDCWEWQACRTRDGYGAFNVGGKPQLAHRVAWFLENGLMSSGMQVCHHCDNPPCVNPKHLFLGTMADNIRDMDEKGRRGRPISGLGSNHPNSKITEDQVVEIRKRYKGGGTSFKKLGAEYGLNPVTVFELVHRITWKHVPESEEFNDHNPST